MYTQININEANEDALKKIKTIAAINNKALPNKEFQINFAINLASELIDSLDEETLINVVNLKKSI